MDTNREFDEVQNRVNDMLRSLESATSEASFCLQEITRGFVDLGTELEKLRHIIGDTADEGQPGLKVFAYGVVSWKSRRIGEACEHLKASLMAFSEAARLIDAVPTDAETQAFLQ